MPFARSRRRRLLRSRRAAASLHLAGEALETRLALAASVGFDARQGLILITGSEAADVVTVTQRSRSVVVAVAGGPAKTFNASQVRSIAFRGLGGDDTFTNNTSIRCTADGGPGRDTLRGGSNSDDLRGGRDGDILLGNGGDDLLFGGAGDDRIDGGGGKDRCYGELGADDLRGGADDDTLSGGDDNDDLYGDAGNDDLNGDAGDDILDGRTGRDRIRGGAGLDREDDADDRFEDGDDDGDGYDNDHDRPVNPGVATPITFTETEPGVFTARLTGSSAGERDRDYYSFTATATETLTIAIVPDATGGYAEVEVKDGATGRELLELEPGEDGIATGRMPVVAGKAYVIRVHSSEDRLPVDYAVDLKLDATPISPIIGTEIVFDPTGFAQLAGTVVGEDTKKVYSFTAVADGSLAITLRPGANGRYAELEVKRRSDGRELLELEPRERYGRTTGTVTVVAGETYVIEIEADDDLATDFTVDLQLS